MARDLTRGRIWTARAIAVAADLLQIVVLPLFVGGAISPLDDLLELFTGTFLILLLGWHWAFVPALAAELVPILDLFPTWTAAVLYVTAGEGGPAPPGPEQPRKPPKNVDPVPDREPPLLPPPEH